MGGRPRQASLRIHPLVAPALRRDASATNHQNQDSRRAKPSPPPAGAAPMSSAFSPLALALVALGGALGSVARYVVSVQGVLRFGTNFPWGTLAVNVLGSAAIGVLGALPLQQEARLFLITGCLGGFTTFSAFSLETELLAQRTPWLAAGYVGLSLVLGLAACALCYTLVRRP